MPAYDEVLAQQILLALQEVFPNKLASHDLKGRPPFVEVPEDQWMLALDALLKLRLIDGKTLREGSALYAAANLEITPQGRAHLSSAVARGSQTGAKHGPSNENLKTLVTVNGECFEAEYIQKGNSSERDGGLYLFKLKDLLKDRGERLVSLFRTGTDRVSIENYDARVETVRLNVIRRAFDSGAFGFETAVDDDRYHELRLRAADFQPQRKADDETIRRFIKFGAYYLGFRFASNGPAVLDFDCPEDLDYLGAKSEDIGRNVWFLSQKGYLRSSPTATYSHPLRCSATSELIDEMERGDGDSPQPIGANVTQHFHLHGPNSRVNMNSTDNSLNVTSISNDNTFVQMREVAQSISDESERATIISRLDALESAKGTTGFLPAYQSFISSVANYMTIFGPFIPALTQMLSGGN